MGKKTKPNFDIKNVRDVRHIFAQSGFSKIDFTESDKEINEKVIVHLGEALLASGDKEVAKKEWKELLKNFPESEQTNTIRFYLG